MGTVIDELIVALKLDPKGFTKGQKEAGAAFLKTRDSAVKTGKEIETSATKTANAISKLAREVLLLFGAIAAGRGLKDLVEGLTTGNAELGRFSANLAISPQTVAAWGAATQRFGGSAAAFDKTLAGLNQQLFDFRTNGKGLPTAASQLAGFSRVDIPIDRLKTANDYLRWISKATYQLAKTDRNKAFNLASSLGIDDATINLMIKQGDQIDRYIGEIERTISPSDKAIEAAQKLQASWAEMTQQIGKAASDLYATIGPIFTELISKMSDWLSKNREFVTSGITDAVKQFAEALSKVDWTGIGNGFGTFAKAATDTAEAIRAIVEGIATMSTWFSGTPLKAAPGNANWERDWKEKLGGPGAANLHPEAPLNPKVLREWLDSTPSGNEADTTVDGRPVSKSNPLPVTTVNSEAGSGGGFWSNLWDSVKGAMSGASVGALGSGGSLISAGARKLAGGGADEPGGTAASVPDIAGMTADERNKLGLILKYESGGRNVMNYEGRGRGIDPTKAKGFTAQGYYQILNSNWRRLAPKLGIAARNAMAATLEEQTKVALALMRESGIKNWSNFNAKLNAALRRGEQAGAWAKRVPTPMPTAGIATGAKGSAALSSVSNDNRSTTNSSSSYDTRIGVMNIQTQAHDPNHIADTIWGAVDNSIRRTSTAATANYGPA